MIDNILEYIDDIETSTIAAECNVICAMSDLIYKEAVITEYYGDDMPDWYQEGVLDKVEGQSKNDSNKLISILAFIPRLLIAMASSIATAIKKSKIGQKMSVAMKKLGGLKDKQAKEAYCEEINAKSNGEFTAFVNSKGEIAFRKGSSRIIADAIALYAITTQLPKISKNVESLVKTKQEMGACIDELDSMCELMKDAVHPTGSKEMRDTAVSTNVQVQKSIITFNSINTMVDNLGGIASGVKNVSEGFSSFLSSAEYKNYLKGLDKTAKGKIINKANNITNTLGQVSGFVGTGVSGVAKLLGLIGKVVETKNKKKVTLSDARAACIMLVFFKDPVHPNDPKLGLTRVGLEKLYPLGKNEQIDAYNDRIDEIMRDIGDEFAAVMTREKGRDQRVVDAAFDIDEKVIKLRRNSDSDVYVPFELTTNGSDGKSKTYPAGSMVPYYEAARALIKMTDISKLSKADKKMYMKSAEASHENMKQISNNGILEEINTQRENVAKAIEDDNAKMGIKSKTKKKS